MSTKLHEFLVEDVQQSGFQSHAEQLTKLWDKKVRSTSIGDSRRLENRSGARKRVCFQRVSSETIFTQSEKFLEKFFNTVGCHGLTFRYLRYLELPK
jgi:hypothetical protein